MRKLKATITERLADDIAKIKRIGEKDPRSRGNSDLSHCIIHHSHAPVALGWIHNIAKHEKHSAHLRVQTRQSINCLRIHLIPSPSPFHHNPSPSRHDLPPYFRLARAPVLTLPSSLRAIESHSLAAMSAATFFPTRWSFS